MRELRLTEILSDVPRVSEQKILCSYPLRKITAFSANILAVLIL